MPLSGFVRQFHTLCILASGNLTLLLKKHKPIFLRAGKAINSNWVEPWYKVSASAKSNLQAHPTHLYNRERQTSGRQFLHIAHANSPLFGQLHLIENVHDLRIAAYGRRIQALQIFNG